MEIETETQDRPEWRLAEDLLAAKEPAATTEQWMSLAAEVIRLRDYGYRAYELLEADRGWDIQKHLVPQIRGLYRCLNEYGRYFWGVQLMTFWGVEVPADVMLEWPGVDDPNAQWNRLVEIVATATVSWLANARWAVLEHREADRLRGLLGEPLVDPPPHVSGGRTEEPPSWFRGLTDRQFRDLLDLMMVSDPWPLTPEADGTLGGLLDDESRKRGFDSWVIAYHEFTVEI